MNASNLGRKTEDGENKLIWLKREPLEIYAIFSNDGVEEMTRNASCFVNNQLKFLLKASKSNTLRVQ